MVERYLAKVEVEGSSPFARFRGPASPGRGRFWNDAPRRPALRMGRQDEAKPRSLCRGGDSLNIESVFEGKHPRQESNL